MFTRYIRNKNFRHFRDVLLSLSVAVTLWAQAPALATPIVDTEAQESLAPNAPPPVLGTVQPGEMLVYSPKKKVNLSTLVSLGPPEALGGQVLKGHPMLFGRTDFAEGNMRGGLFMATRGLIRVTFPFTEHATILEGSVTLTDERGRTHTFKEGDSYFIRQGSVILWDVKGAYVIKSFFNVMEPTTP